MACHIVRHILQFCGFGAGPKTRLAQFLLSDFRSPPDFQWQRNAMCRPSKQQTSASMINLLQLLQILCFRECFCAVFRSNQTANMRTLRSVCRCPFCSFTLVDSAGQKRSWHPNLWRFMSRHRNPFFYVKFIDSNDLWLR